MTPAGTEGSLFRIARVPDAEAIARLHDRSIRAAYRKIIPVSVLDTMKLADRAARWREWITDREIDVLLREVEDEVVGFVSLCPSRDDDADPLWVGEIPTLYIDPSHWRARFGSDLLHAALGLARERGFREVTLWVLEKNRLARGFYEAHGFRWDGGSKPDPSLPEPALTAVRYRKTL
jgi:ribosomal protein S18 acetylase RimI-like enzyme